MFKATETPPRPHHPEIISLLEPEGHSVAFRSDKICGFGYENDAYIVCLSGGGTVRVRFGQNTYEALKTAMEWHL